MQQLFASTMINGRRECIAFRIEPGQIAVMSVVVACKCPRRSSDATVLQHCIAFYPEVGF
eukprot:1460217-Amphidinium_carterae.1